MISRQDIFLGIIVMAIWAMHTIVIKMITIELEPVTALMIRVVLSSALFLPFIRKVSRKQLIILFQISMLMAVLHWGTLFWAMDRLEASVTIIIMQIQIIFAIFWGIVLFGERIGWRSGVGVLLGLIGIVILVGMPEQPPSIPGVIALILSMVFVSLCYARMKALSGMSPLNYLAYMNAMALIPTIILAFVMERPLEFDWGGVDYAYITLPLFFQIVVVGISHIIWQRLLTRNDMTVLPNLILLMPFMGVIFAMLILGETLTTSMIFGGLLTTAGVGIILIRKSQKAIKAV